MAEPIYPDPGSSIYPDGHYRLVIGRLVVIVDRSGTPINDAEQSKLTRELDMMITKFPFTRKSQKP